MTTIRYLLDQANGSAPSDSSKYAFTKISLERHAIDAYLARSDIPPVYGFTTLLGHLDSRPARAEDQQALLDGHLIGTPEPMPLWEFRLVTATKITQLSQGGSGISPGAFQRVLDSLHGTTPDTTGAWTASYGCGDVVPGAWWAHRVFGSYQSWLPGDVIALINGNFFSTARAIVALMAAADFAVRFLTTMAPIVPIPAPQGVDRELESALAGQNTQDLITPRGVQLRVSLRDLQPFVTALVTALRMVRDRIMERLQRPSANPLFSLDGSDVSPISQNSFLDVSLTSALRGLSETVSFCMAGLQGLIEHECSTRQGQDGVDGFPYVQPPKVARARAMRALSICQSAVLDFTLAESHGIEDICDLSLFAGDDLIGLSRSAATLLDMLPAPPEITAEDLDTVTQRIRSSAGL